MSSEIALTSRSNPLMIIQQATFAQDEKKEHKFNKQIKYLYACEIFKNILDIVATKAQQGQLIFKVQDQEFFAMDEGNCRSVVYENSGGIFGFAKKKRYVITIKKISTDVIIHEIAHMVEQELELIGLFHGDKFAKVIMQDFVNIPQNIGNPALQEAIRQIMFIELEGYTKDHHISELFARFFQMFAMSKELLYDLQHIAKYDISQLGRAFPATIAYFNQEFAHYWRDLIDQNIAIASQSYIKDLAELNKGNLWAGRRIDSIHGPSYEKALAGGGEEAAALLLNSTSASGVKEVANNRLTDGGKQQHNSAQPSPAGKQNELISAAPGPKASGKKIDNKPKWANNVNKFLQ